MKGFVLDLVADDALGSMADRDDDTVISDDCIGVELWLKLLESIVALHAAESVAGVMVKKHQFAAPAVGDRAAVGQQAFQNSFGDSPLLQADSGMVG